MRSFLKSISAMLAWAAVHSLLASNPSKRTIRDLLGQQREHALYRVGYNSIAILTTAALATYLRRLPDREIYRLRGPLRFGSALLRALLLAIVLRAAIEIGIGSFSGLSELRDFLLHHRAGEAPEAQGPALGSGGLRTGGPFRYVRHPLNAAAAAYVFLTPSMTVVRLAVALATLLYVILGSRLEERRLLLAYGEPYRRYLESGIPFLLPRLHQPARECF